jgi:hypothetical protein
MALSAKQRKQNQLARERDELRVLPDSTYEFLKAPFHEYVESDPNWSNVTLPFDLIGMEPPAFEDGRDPGEFAAVACFRTDADRDDAFQGYIGSIGRAEVMVGCLLDAAVELAGIIQTYKKKAIAVRRNEIEGADLSDPDIRREALEEITRLARIEEILSKNVRRTLPQWEVKGL